VLKINLPDTPEVPALAVTITTLPLVVAVPSPLESESKPPVTTVLVPATTCNDPPEPLVPLPTDNEIRPPRPAVAAPDPRTMLPLFPALLLPELNTNEPLVPAFPALMERTSTMPLLVAVPSPLAMLTAPPVCTVLRPA